MKKYVGFQVEAFYDYYPSQVIDILMERIAIKLNKENLVPVSVSTPVLDEEHKEVIISVLAY